MNTQQNTENNRYRLELPHRGYGMSLGNMLEVLSGKAAANPEVNWIDVEETEPGVFTVVDDNMTVKDGFGIVDNTNLGFCSWDDEVEDLDAGDSDESQCFGMSDHLRWRDVELRLGWPADEFRAPSVERLKEALHHVAICAWCPGDI